MNLKTYRENVSQQIDFLEKLKEKASDDAKKTIDSTLDLIYKDISKKITPAEVESDINASSQNLIDDRKNDEIVFTRLINEYHDAAKKTRTISNWGNLGVIILSIISFSIFLFYAYRYTNELSKPYLLSEQQKYMIIDSMVLQSSEEYYKVLKNLDTYVKKSNPDSLISSPVNKNIINTIDSLKTNLKEIETVVNNMNSKESVFSKIQPIIYFHIILMVVFIIAIITTLMYIVKVMVNLFRYNSILADHYEAVADSIKIIRHSSLFGNDLNFEKVYSIVHPQRDKLLEVSASVDLDPDKTIDKLNGIIDKIKISKS
jgi:hypothetical protein